jgi:hypothetical protein
MTLTTSFMPKFSAPARKLPALGRWSDALLPEMSLTSLRVLQTGCEELNQLAPKYDVIIVMARKAAVLIRCLIDKGMLNANLSDKIVTSHGVAGELGFFCSGTDLRILLVDDSCLVGRTVTRTKNRIQSEYKALDTFVFALSDRNVRSKVITRSCLPLGSTVAFANDVLRIIHYSRKPYMVEFPSVNITGGGLRQGSPWIQSLLCPGSQTFHFAQESVSNPDCPEWLATLNAKNLIEICKIRTLEQIADKSESGANIATAKITLRKTRSDSLWKSLRAFFELDCTDSEMKTLEEFLPSLFSEKSKFSPDADEARMRLVQWLLSYALFSLWIESFCPEKCEANIQYLYDELGVSKSSLVLAGLRKILTQRILVSRDRLDPSTLALVKCLIPPDPDHPRTASVYDRPLAEISSPTSDVFESEWTNYFSQVMAASFLEAGEPGKREAPAQVDNEFNVLRHGVELSALCRDSYGKNAKIVGSVSISQSAAIDCCHDRGVLVPVTLADEFQGSLRSVGRVYRYGEDTPVDVAIRHLEAKVAEEAPQNQQIVLQSVKRILFSTGLTLGEDPMRLRCSSAVCPKAPGPEKFGFQAPYFTKPVRHAIDVAIEIGIYASKKEINVESSDFVERTVWELFEDNRIDLANEFVSLLRTKTRI